MQPIREKGIHFKMRAWYIEVLDREGFIWFSLLFNEIMRGAALAPQVRSLSQENPGHNIKICLKSCVET